MVDAYSDSSLLLNFVSRYTRCPKVKELFEISLDDNLRFLAKSIDTLGNRYDLIIIDSYLDEVSPLRKRQTSRTVAD